MVKTYNVYLKVIIDEINMIEITPHISIKNAELKITFIRSPGPGGQNVNKVATGVVLRFNVADSPSFTEEVRDRLLKILGKQLTADGDIIIKATRYRTQSRNKEDAIERLQAILKKASFIPKKRKKTKPTKASKQRRLDTKKIHGKTKSLRRKNPKNHD